MTEAAELQQPWELSFLIRKEKVLFRQAEP